jgi:membrane protein involved in colicin uptake
MTTKKPRQSRHRVPPLTMVSDGVDDDYQAEVDASVARLEARYRKAEKALAAAEDKAERKRLVAEALAEKHRQAEAAAAHRAEEESRLTEYIERIKEAAKNSRVAEARAELERKHREAVERRNAQTAQRKTEAKAVRDFEKQIAAARASSVSLQGAVVERRRELREIELLMMPGNYSGRDHRKRAGQHFSNYRGDRP